MRVFWPLPEPGGAAAAGRETAGDATTPDERRAVAAGGDRRAVETHAASGHLSRLEVRALGKRGG
jgi:hypothetical protein